MTDFIEITSKYKGWCKECAGDIEIGTKVLWQKGYGAKHLECIEQIDEVNEPVDVPVDPESHTYAELLKIHNCQDCGADVSGLVDRYINDDRVVCHKHFGTKE